MDRKIELPVLPMLDVGLPGENPFAYSDEAMLAFAEKAVRQAIAGHHRDLVDAERYRLAVADCILVLRGDAALGRAEWDSKLDKLAKTKGTER
ncbi:hypothetical protein [Achromobacter marplatensis]|uniref:hypothetical protein n=1 Tax=Achromobacter marplatensis TaxID=470868 RepID=UPI0028E58840|nr:hypothetical protein [Achromobacter marplatensis]